MKRLALVTGGAKRIGKNIVQHLAQDGWNVIIHYNQSKSEAEDLKAELDNGHPEQDFHLSSFDLNDWEDAGAYMDALIREFGSPDLIVHNASIFEAGTIKETSAEKLKENMAVHFLSPFMITQSAAKHKNEMNVLAILDTRITSNEYKYAAYLLSKKSLADFVKMAALELAPLTRVNGIAIGAALPPQGESLNYIKDVIDSTPLKVQVRINNITDSIDFLLKNNTITGQILFCDSGKHLN